MRGTGLAAVAPLAGSPRWHAVRTAAASPLLAMLALILIGAWLRWTQLYRQSLWEDEITSGIISESHIRDLMWLVANNDVHPPLYYLIAHAAYYWLGLGVVESLRVPSLVAGVATVAVMYLLGWQLAGRWAGTVAAALTAVSPLAVWYSHEGRMYALTWLLVLLSYLLLARALERQRAWWLVAYALATGLALWSDVSAFLGVLPQAAVAAWELRTRWRAFLAFVAGLALYAPWLPSLRSQWHLLVRQGFLVSSTWPVWSHLALAQLGLDAAYAALPDLVPAAVVALVLAAYAALAVIGWRAVGPRLLFGAALALGPVGLGLALATLGSRAVLVPRVEGLSSFGFSLTAGLLVAGALRSPRVWTRASALLAAALIAGGAVAGLAREIQAGTNGQPWSAWVRQVDREARPGDAVLVLPASLQVATHAYLPADSAVNRRALVTWGGAPAQLDPALLARGSARGRVWILYLDTTGIGIREHDAYLRVHGLRRIEGDPGLPMGVLGYARG